MYIRKENEERWDNITDKSAWVNAMLEKSPPNSIVEREKLEPIDAQELVNKDFNKAVNLCPHGFPKNGWSCKKGCK